MGKVIYMPDMSVKGSSSSYHQTYFQPLTKNSKNDETANNQKDKPALGVSDDSAIKLGKEKQDKSGKPAELSDGDKTTIQEMKAIENEVIAHEQAHKSAGGSIAGAASYSYAMGPDGKRYISGGEVSIQTPATDDKEKKVKLLDRVKQAALAPAQPSPQDIRVAAGATSEQLQLNAAIQRERGLKAYSSDDKTPQSGEGKAKNENSSKSESPGSPSRAVGNQKNKVPGQYFDQVG